MSVTKASILSAEQQRIEDKLGKYLTSKVGRTATPYAGQLVAEMPSLFRTAYKTLESSLGQYSDVIRSALLGAVRGEPAWQTDIGSITKQFREQFASPLMETWKSTVAPILQETFASIPGGFYTAARGRSTEAAANRYFGQYVQPQLWSALENARERMFRSTEAAAARVPGAAAQLLGLPSAEFELAAGAAERMQAVEQAPLTAKYQEFLRTTEEASPWLPLGLQYLGIPTHVVFPKAPKGPSFGEQLLGAATGMGLQLGGMYLGGAMGLPQMWGLGGATSSSGAGMSFSSMAKSVNALGPGVLGPAI